MAEIIHDISVRETILEAIAAKFESVEAGVDGYYTTWNKVYRGPIPPEDNIDLTALSIMTGPEDANNSMSVTTKNLSLVIEFVKQNLLGEVVDTEMNKLLLDIQRVMLEDPQWGCLTLNTLEMRNEITPELPDNKESYGVAEFLIQYRHLVDDPRIQM